MKTTPCILIAILFLCGCSQNAAEPTAGEPDQRSALIVPNDQWKEKHGDDLASYQSYNLAVIRNALGQLANRLEAVEDKTALLEGYSLEDQKAVLEALGVDPGE